MKRLFNVALLSGVSLIAMTSPSLAAFGIGAGILSGVLSTTGVALAVSPTLIGNVILGAASIGANFLLNSRKGGKRPDPGEAKNTFESSEGPEINAVGRVRISGNKAFGNVSPDGYSRYRLYLHSRGILDGIEEHFLGGRPVVVDGNGAVSSPPWARPNNASYAYISTKIGDGTETAWGDLTTNFPALWSSAHRVRGIAQTLVRAISPGIDLNPKKYSRLFQGSNQDYENVGRYGKIYDPRIVGHIVDNETTWEWSDNGILVAAHVMRRFPEINHTDFDWSLIGVSATAADVLVNTKTGTEKRARAWGVWFSDDNRVDVVQDILRSIGAEMRITSAGKITFDFVDDSPTSEFTFLESDIYEIDWSAGPEAVARSNVAEVKYYSPERNYEMATIETSSLAWANITSEINRYGRKREEISLPFCPSASQAQRIARREFATRRAATGRIVTTMVGLAMFGKRYCVVPLPDIGDILVKIDAPRVMDDEGKIEIPFIQVPTLLPFNATTDEAAAPEQIPDLSYATDIDPPSLVGGGESVTLQDNSKQFRVGYFSLPAGTTILETAYRTYSGGNPNAWQPMTEVGLTSGLTHGHYAYINADLVGQEIDIRYRGFDDDEDGSVFAPILNIPSVSTDQSVPDHLVKVPPTGSPWTITDNGSEGSAATEDYYAFSATFNSNDLGTQYLIFEENVASVWTERDREYVNPTQTAIFGISITKTHGDPAPSVRVRAVNSDGFTSTPLNY